MFTYVPFGSFRVDLQQPLTTDCQSSVLPTASCQTTPTLLEADGVTYLAWNWSTDPLLDDMYAGDVWTASFYLVATGPPFDTPVPVDSCVTTACEQNGSMPVGTLFSAVSFEPSFATYPEPPLATISFPPALVIVDGTSTQTPVTSVPNPPPPPGPGLPAPSPVPSPFPVSLPISVAGTAVATAISVPAIAAGIMGAGLARVVLQRRAVAQGQPVGNVVRPTRSAFDEDRPTDPKVGRFD
jgi:hypothetical protein